MTAPDLRRPARVAGAPAVLAGDATDEGEVELNATAYAIWELCDGTTSVEEMVDAASALFDADPGTIRHDVERILRKLGRSGLVSWDDDGGAGQGDLADQAREAPQR